MKTIVHLPSPRYWCSESQALIEIKYRIVGKHTDKIPLPERKRMYDHIYERYLEEKQFRPDSTIADIVFDIVNSPAPESFISESSANIILNRHRNKIRSGMVIDSPCQHQLFLRQIKIPAINEVHIIDDISTANDDDGDK